MLPLGSSVSSAGLEARLYGRRGRPPPQTALANFPQRGYPQDMNRKLIAITLVALVWNGLAFCGEIHDATKAGDLAKVKALLKENPDLVNSKDKEGETPLHLTVIWGKHGKEIAELLLTNKADINAKDRYGTPLHYAAAKGDTNMVALFLANKADINAKDNGGGTPLGWAVVNNREDVVELLLKNKADVNTKNNEGRTPLHSATSFWSVAELLVVNKADVNAKDNNGMTPLHGAGASGNRRVAELLITYHADVNARDNHGATPLRWALIGNHKDVADLLRQHGGHE
jgi:ankyrin repeat protein